MSMFPNSQSRPYELGYGTDNRVAFNFFNAVYAWMAVGLAVTAATGYLVSQTPAIFNVLYGRGTGMALVILLGVWAVAYAAQKVALEVSAALGTALFLLYAVLIGALLSGIFLVYDGKTLIASFALTGGTFAAMSVFGFVTKRDLTTMGSYLAMAVIGLIIATVVNLFVASSLLSWVITYAVLFVFMGLTAYHTQNLRNMAAEVANDSRQLGRLSVYGSIVLYIAFISMFTSILRILGDRR